MHLISRSTRPLPGFGRCYNDAPRTTLDDAGEDACSPLLHPATVRHPSYFQGATVPEKPDFDFRAWLQAIDLTQAEAASEIGVSEDFVSMLLADPSSPRYRKPSARVISKCRSAAAKRLKDMEERLRPFL